MYKMQLLTCFTHGLVSHMDLFYTWDLSNYSTEYHLTYMALDSILFASTPEGRSVGALLGPQQLGLGCLEVQSAVVVLGIH